MTVEYVPTASQVQVNPNGYIAWDIGSFSIEPQITALANGNYVVVYGRYVGGNTPVGTWWDVYAQVLAPDGTKIGSEIAVNAGTR